MTTSTQLREKLSSLVKQRARAEEKSALARHDEAKHRSKAAKHRHDAARAASLSSVRSHLSSAEREERAADADARKAADAAKLSSTFSTKEAAIQKDLARAQERETRQDLRERAREAQDREQSRLAERHWTQGIVARALRQVRPPKPEALRVLYLTATSKGDLRVDEEIRRVRAAVRAATHRDLLQIEHMPAATASDLLDGLMRFRPHVLHFSGHGSEHLLVFDTGSSDHSPGNAVGQDAFALAVGSVDTPPLLVVLNACNSHGHAKALLQEIPLVIGMSDTVGDRDAMVFAARFYGAIAEGQSVLAAHALGRTQMRLDGLEDASLPTLSHAADVDPASVVLVQPPPSDLA